VPGTFKGGRWVFPALRSHGFFGRGERRREVITVVIGGDGRRQPDAPLPGGPPDASDAHRPVSEDSRRPREPATRRVRIQRLVQAIRDSDESAVTDVVVQLSRSRPLFAPIAMAVGAVAVLFRGVKLLFINWRLTLVQILPAMWIWLAMLDLKAHVLHGRSFHVVHGPVALACVLGIAAITAASFFLNAVFAFAIARPGTPLIRPGFREARSHLALIVGWGAVVGLGLGLSTIVVTRWHSSWFVITLSIIIGVMMVVYVAVPGRLIGVRPARSRRDKLTASMLGGIIGAVVCAPGYLLGRIGLLMFGSEALLIPGAILFAVGLTLQAGTTGAVTAIKMSAKLVGGGPPPPPAGSSSAQRKRPTSNPG
jgi:hypothetical protein